VYPNANPRFAFASRERGLRVSHTHTHAHTHTTHRTQTPTAIHAHMHACHVQGCRTQKRHPRTFASSRADANSADVAVTGAGVPSPSPSPTRSRSRSPSPSASPSRSEARLCTECTLAVTAHAEGENACAGVSARALDRCTPRAERVGGPVWVCGFRVLTAIREGG